MNRIDELRQQIDAFRAGSDDLHRPELADLARAIGPGGGAADPAVAREFDRAQRFDRCVVSALHDVAVPPGLLEKLLAQASTPPSDDQPAVLDGTIAAATRDAIATVDDSAVNVPSPPARVSRRWALSLAAGGLIAASSLAIGLVIWSAAARRFSVSDLAADVTNWIGQVTPPAGWQLGGPTKNLSGQFPTDDLRPGLRVTRWQTFTTTRRERAVVYDVAPFANEEAWLFVVSTPHEFRVASGPLTVLPGITGGWSAGAWQRGRLLFVLVVGPGGREPKDYLRPVREA